jgi:hypothetical protein
MLIKDILYHGLMLARGDYLKNAKLNDIKEIENNTMKNIPLCNVFDITYMPDGVSSLGLRKELVRLPYKLIWLELVSKNNINIPDGNVKIDKKGIVLCDLGDGFIEGINIIQIIGQNIITSKWKYEVCGETYLECCPSSFGDINFNMTNKAIDFIQLINAKNVECKETLIKMPNKKFAGVLRGKNVPFLINRIVYINYKGVSRKLSDIFAETDQDVEKRIHSVRGHFSTYTEDAPLFGKLTGTFWIPPHWRGSEDVGRVDKTYKIIGKEDVVSVVN